MSTYEKYFSDTNKTHMYHIIKDIIRKEKAIDIDRYPRYKEIFTTYYPRVFDLTEGESIIDCNKTLIDTICPLILDMSGSVIKLPVNLPVNLPERLPEKKDSQTKEQTIHIFSSERNFETSLHRYNYQTTLSHACDSIQLESITLPEEDNSLFAFPVIQVRLTLLEVSQEDTITEYSLICKLDDTKYLGDRNYIQYIPESEIQIPYSSMIQIDIVDPQGNHCIHTTDQMICQQSKNLQKDVTYTCIKVEPCTQVNVSDTLCISRNSAMVANVQIKEIVSSYLVFQESDIRPDDILINLSLQNHLVFKGFTQQL